MTVSETVSAGQLRAFIERIERLEEEKKTIADDIKEVKAEAKGTGFDVGAINALIKLRKMGSADRQEKEAILDIYKAALGMLPLEEYAERDEAASKLVATVATGMQTEIGRKALVAAIDIMIDAETGEITEQEQPETASQSGHQRMPTTSLAAREADESAAPIPQSVVVAPRPSAPAESAPDEISAPIPHSPAVLLPGKADKTSEAVVPPEASSLVAPFDNPRCLNACHLAHSKEACHDCLIAWSQRPKDEQVRLWAEANEAAQVPA